MLASGGESQEFSQLQTSEEEFVRQAEDKINFQHHLWFCNSLLCWYKDGYNGQLL